MTRDTIFEALRVDDLSADYVILVDTSGSMKGAKYAQTKQALSTFLGAISPNDHISLVTFDVAPAIRYSGPAGSSNAAAAQLPAEATGRMTDIGAAIETALDELERPDAADVATIILLTDGVHEPPKGSAYPQVNGSAWDTLSQRAASHPERVIKAYSLGLEEKTDAALLKSVFPNASVVALPPDQLAPYLERVKEQTRIAKAQRILQGDLAGVVQVRFPPDSSFDMDEGSGSLQVELTSMLKYVPVAVEGLTVNVDGASVTAVVDPAGSVSLAPGETKSIEVTLEWSPPKDFRVGREEIIESGQATMTASVTSPWGAVLTDDLGLGFTPTLAVEGGIVNTRGWIGMAYSTVALLAGILLLALGIIAYLLNARRPRLRGSLRVSTPGSASLEIVLGGHKVDLARASKGALPGKGSVSGKRIKRRGKRGSDVQLVVRYAKDGRTYRTGSLEWGRTTVVDGTTFVHRA
ncbi:MAG: VWA domain-containing protein [Coriobacteriia bacterium]|nr:VWA domain-containing protein [Coriobacteriia bacterium]